MLSSQTYLLAWIQQQKSMLTTKSCKKLWQGRKLTSSCVQALARKPISARFLQRRLSLQTTLDSLALNSSLTTTQSSRLTKQSQVHCLLKKMLSTLSLKMEHRGFTETETLTFCLQLLEHTVHGLTKMVLRTHSSMLSHIYSRRKKATSGQTAKVRLVDSAHHKKNVSR